MANFIRAIRGLVYKPFFGHLGIPSLFSKPMKLRGIKHAFIGKRFRIMSGARFEITDGGKLIIGDNCSFGPNLHFSVGGPDALTIGHDVTVSGNVLIANLNHDYQQLNVHSLEQAHLFKTTSIGDYCFIGFGAVILPGTHLGTQVIVGANSVVHGDFPDYCVIAGNPARIIKKYDPATKKWDKV